MPACKQVPTLIIWLEMDEPNEFNERLIIAALLEERARLRRRLTNHSTGVSLQEKRNSNVPISRESFLLGNVGRRQKQSRKLASAEHDQVRKRVKGLLVLHQNVGSRASQTENTHSSKSDNSISHCPNLMNSVPNNMTRISLKSTNQCRHLDDRRIRERERELDRLGRLLRRAAELDVSRCCNDVRTLLLARSHAEEMGLRIPAPPTSHGQICFDTTMALHFASNRTSHDTTDARNRASVSHVLGFPHVVSPLPMDRGRNTCKLDFFEYKSLLEISDFLHTFNAPLKIRNVPNIAELVGALAKIESDSNNQRRLGYKLLSSIAIVLMRMLLPELVTFLGSSRLSINESGVSDSWIDLNEMTWQALARSFVLMAFFRELGFADSDILPELCGTGGWMPTPNSESHDYVTMALITARISIKCTDQVSKLSPKCVMHIPVPKRRIPVPGNGDSPSIHRFKSLNDQPFPDRVNKGQLPRGVISAKSNLAKSQTSEPVLKTSTHIQRYTSSITQRSLAIVESLLAQPEARKFDYISKRNADLSHHEASAQSNSLADIKDAILAGRYRASWISFARDVRRIFQTCHCQLPEGCDSMHALTKLSANFEQMLRENNAGYSVQAHAGSYPAGCKMSTRLECSPLVRCDRCNTDYHVDNPQNSSTTAAQLWFCPLCVGLVHGPGSIDGIIAAVLQFGGFSYIAESILVPGCNTLLPTPHVVFSRQDGEFVQILLDDLVDRPELSHRVVVKNAGWAMPGGHIPHKLDPEISRHAANNLEQNNESHLFSLAIGALSSDRELDKRDWINVLGALVACSSSVIEASSCLSSNLAEKGADLPLLTASTVEHDNVVTTDEIYLANSVLETNIPVEIPNSSNRRKQRELLLVAGVVQDAISFVKFECATMDANNLQLQTNANRGLMQEVMSVGDFGISRSSFMNPAAQDGMCVWCGGDYDYLRSAFVPAQHESRTVPIFVQGARETSVSNSPISAPIGLALAHEFCFNCLAGQRAGSWSRRRQRMLMGYKEKLLFSGRGRTQPLGSDDYGRIYWYFAQHPNLLSIQSVVNRHHESFHNEAWLYFCTIPSITQLVMYIVGLSDAQYDVLLRGILLAFPEASDLSASSREYPLSNFSYNQLTWSELEHRALASIDHNTSPQPHFQTNENLLVRVSELLWTATVTSIVVSKMNGTVYQVKYRRWGEVFDDYLSDEYLIMNSTIGLKAQQVLFQDRFVPHHNRKPGDMLDQIYTLKAYDFVGKPFRIEHSLPSELGPEPFESGNQTHYIREALMTILAALPTGSLSRESNTLFQFRTIHIKQTCSAVELTELVLALEDSLNKSCLRSSWSMNRACLPSRTHLLKYASLSQVALLVWVLDCGIIYDLFQFNRSNSPETTPFDKSSEKMLPFGSPLDIRYSIVGA